MPITFRLIHLYGSILEETLLVAKATNSNLNFLSESNEMTSSDGGDSSPDCQVIVEVDQQNGVVKHETSNNNEYHTEEFVDLASPSVSFKDVVTFISFPETETDTPEQLPSPGN